MLAILKKIEAIVWGPVLIFMILGIGLLFTIRLRGIQFRRFPYVIKNTLMKMFDKHELAEGEISPFQALATALAATVGTGNILGVTTAILLGGPGAVFWMWVAAILGMTTKFAEVALSVAYREKREDGSWAGGPMYYLDKGLGFSGLAKFFAFFAALATFGIGDSTQSNAIAKVLETNFGFSPILVGMVLTILVAIAIIGGIQSIAKVAEKLVPFMAFFYIVGGLFVFFANYQAIPSAFLSIFQEAFNTKAAVGGFAGSVMLTSMRAGIARGVFTNEAGLGSSPIAQASSSVDHPIRQAIWGIFEVFVDTIIVCSITALVLITSGVLIQEGITADLAIAETFSSVFTWGKYIVTIGLTLFAFSTILGWEYYGETSARYLLGDWVIWPYRLLYILMCFVGTTVELGVIWLVADILNALMAFPNLIGLAFLSGDVVRLSEDFFANPNYIRKSSLEYEHLLKGRKRIALARNHPSVDSMYS